MTDEAMANVAPDSDVTNGVQIPEKLKKIALITVMHPRFKQAVDAVERCVNSFGKTGEPVCASILGDSGCGKSHLADRFERRFPRSREDGQSRVPVLRIRVPSDPKIKSVAATMLARLGDPLYTRGTEAQISMRVQQLLKKCDTRLVIMEEFQHFVDKESEKLHLSATNWIKIQIEETKVPFVVEGLRRTKLLFDADDQLADRFDGPYYLVPFQWFEPGEEPRVANQSFRSYLSGIHRAMPFSDCVDFSKREIALRFFCASNGVPRRIGKLIAQAAIIVDATGSETIDLETLTLAYSQRSGFRVSQSSNPFSHEFDLEEAENRLEKAARKVTRYADEGVFDEK